MVMSGFVTMDMIIVLHWSENAHNSHNTPNGHIPTSLTIDQHTDADL